MTADGFSQGPCRHGVEGPCAQCTYELAPPAVLVFGPESSGNRLTMELLEALGCHGSTGHRQPFDNGVPPVVRGRPIMWGASLPRNRRWPDIAGRIVKVRQAGYTAHVLVVQRGLYPTLQSQQQRGRVQNRADGERNIVNGLAAVYGEISAHLPDLGFSILLYEELLQRPAAVTRWLAERIGLEWHLGACVTMTRDENAKHWLQRDGLEASR